MRRPILLLPLLLGTPACGPPVAPAEVPAEATERTFDNLLGLMRQRLEVMHEVARYKWAKKAPVEDPVREAALLTDVARRAADHGLDPEFARAFFRGQIEAAKAVQRADFSRWEAVPGGAAGEAPDLAGALRPRIDALNRDLLAELARVSPRLHGSSAASLRGRAEQLLVGEGIGGGVRETAITPLIEASE
jgi:chorismate mutase